MPTDSSNVPIVARGADSRLRRLPFVPAFDGVRGLAVLLVVCSHSRLLDQSILGRWLLKGGSLGVDIFFVLSGFLITALLLREMDTTRGIRFRNFYRRRALRLLPAFVVFLCAQIIYAYATNVPTRLEATSILAAVFYVANWKIVSAHSFPLIAPGLAHIWSLSVEEQFYILWPSVVLLVLGARRSLRTVVTITAVAIIFFAVLRASLVQHTPPGILYFRTDMRADELLVGALAAHVWVRRSIPKRLLVPAAWISLGFAAFCVVRLDFTSRFLYEGGYTAFAVCVGLMLLAILDADWRPTRLLLARPLRAVGVVSYGLYLWHYLIFHGLSRSAGDWAPGTRVVVGLSLTAAATYLSWRFVEKPFLRMKDAEGSPTSALAEG